MHNELTRKDIQMMRDELDYRRTQLRPKLLDAVKEARGFGDLSENFEVQGRQAGEEPQREPHPLLENMIRTAVAHLPDQGAADAGELYDKGDRLCGGGRICSMTQPETVLASQSPLMENRSKRSVRSAEQEMR